jgi:kinesin family protein 20
MRCAIIEAETREEVIREMEERMRSMERVYAKRLMDEVGDEISSTRLG